MDNRGFTIIELIVVVAIIAVLAAIVLVSVTSYINKGKDSSIKANISSIATNAIVYFDSNLATLGTFTNFCNNKYVLTPKQAIVNAGSNADEFRCYDSASTWCVCATLIGGSDDTFCADYTGYKKQTSGGFCSSRCHDDATKYCTDS
jgi:prepilin-type N-terminal cleavage/methylation domain-containing protein